jgi:hypothetical protein
MDLPKEKPQMENEQLEYLPKEELQQLVAEVREFAIEANIPDTISEFFDRVELQAYRDNALKSLVVRLKTYLLTGREEHGQFIIPIYNTWWDHFKSTYFPTWLLDRFPADMQSKVYKFTHILHVCPHLPCDPEVKHVAWMLMSPEQYQLLSGGVQP